MLERTHEHLKGYCCPVCPLLSLPLYLPIWFGLQVGREGMLLKDQSDEPQNENGGPPRELRARKTSVRATL